MPKPKINSDKCTKCGTCVDMCPVSVFKKDGNRIVVDKPDECIGCKSCEVQCPVNAIKVED